MKKSHQSGFAATEAMLILVVVAIIGFTSWFVWNAKENTDKSLDAAAKPVPYLSRDYSFWNIPSKLPQNWYIYSNEKMNIVLYSKEPECNITATRTKRAAANAKNAAAIEKELAANNDDQRVNHNGFKRLESIKLTVHTNTGNREVTAYGHYYQAPDSAKTDGVREMYLIGDGYYDRINASCGKYTDLPQAEKAVGGIMINV